MKIPEKPLDAEHVAIIGMSGRFPGAPDVDRFWKNVRDGVESISSFSEQELMDAGVDPALLRRPNYVRAKASLEHVDELDAPFFQLSAREAEITDPQQRIFLECAWEALESAGYAGQTDDVSIGVFAGAESLSSYFLNNIYPNAELRASVGDYQLILANERDFLCTRVSYKLNLTGPCVTVQTACSTSLVSVYMACQSLLGGQCDMALAGGVSISFPLVSGYLYEEGMVLSPDGRCRAFDAAASGTVEGSGAGVVLLKRLDRALADGDTVHAVIRGAAINNDGSSKIGFTAPSVQGQAEVIAMAMVAARVEPETISYVEAHGTATRVGDPIEIAALKQVFGSRTRKKNFCALGSVKTNIGHLGAAAGIAGLIKTVQALKHAQIPPSLHFQQPNPLAALVDSPFRVSTELSTWSPGACPRRAGVSSFGMGGTNAHVILEEAPAADREASRPIGRRPRLLVLSAKTPTALAAAAGDLRQHLAQHPDLDLSDVAYTLQVGRRAFPHRCAVVCPGASSITSGQGGPADALDAARLSTGIAAAELSVVFMFPGQGTQTIHMASELYETEPVFREKLDRCAELLAPELGHDLRRLLYPAGDCAARAEALKQTAVAQPALFAVEIALATLWISWGIRPDAMIGHSLGEYVAACLAGVFSLEDALSLVAARGRLMQRLPGGAMLAVPLPEDEVMPLVEDEICLAAVNGPSLSVVSGPTRAIDALAERLARRGLACSRLHTSHAFHSSMMDPAVEPFAEEVSKIRLNRPECPYLSNVTGSFITDADATCPRYWARHMRHTVRFGDGVSVLLDSPASVLLEVGPGHTLRGLAQRHPARTSSHVVLSSLPAPKQGRPCTETLLDALGRLWIAGAEVAWPALHSGERRRRVPLPTYPFERQRYWIDPPTLAAGRAKTSDGVEQATSPAESRPADADRRAAAAAQRRPPHLGACVAARDALERTLAEAWQDLLGIQPVGIHDDYFELGGDSLASVRLISRLKDAVGVEVSSRTLLETRTIAGLAQTIRQARSAVVPSRSGRSPLVVIRPGGPGGKERPLFLVHPVGGDVLCYEALSRRLGADQPVYGLQARGLDGAEPPRSRIQDMARDYAGAICAAQPSGPYLLGGWSFGGIVAFEVAQELRRRGEQIALLALIDSGAPGHGFRMSDADDATLLAWFDAELRAAGADEDTAATRPLYSVFTANLAAGQRQLRAARGRGTSAGQEEGCGKGAAAASGSGGSTSRRRCVDSTRRAATCGGSTGRYARDASSIRRRSFR
ncbi:beta-ketoacyl synthase [Sorangium cellulosum]|uniref:Phenolphthiocerol/phthiocerol polyketide synthase subunit E n=1 Tax=Sorangium cellulosum TaxID=56 RepID=A0A2L0F201_SORCE|nr:beta-ketoacyl synthase [Sorangium cellulosum]